MEDKAEITVYSVEYGLTLKNLSAERDRPHINYSVFDQDVNSKFIAKKTIRDNQNKKKRIGGANSRKTTEVADEDTVTIPPTSSLEQPIEEMNLESNKNRERELLPPKEVHKGREKYESSKERERGDKHEAKEQKSQKRKGDETPTRNVTEGNGHKTKSSTKSAKHFTSESGSENEDERRGHGKHRTPDNRKQYARDENDDESQESEEDIHYPAKTNQPLDKRTKR